MKKLLLSLAAAATVMSVSADKVAFVCADSEWTYTGDAKTIITIPEGFYFTDYNDAATMPKTKITKTLSCDVLNIAASGAFSAGKYEGFTTKSVVSKCYAIGGSFRWYTNAGWTITPAPGIKVTKVTVRSQSYTTKTTPGNYVWPITESSTTYDVTNVECPMIYATVENGDKVFNLKSTGGQVRVSWIEFEYTGTTDQPAMPTSNVHVNVPYLAADKELTLTSTDGADIYYTLDGTEPTTSSTKYTGAFKLTSDVIVRAIAVKGDKTSFPLYQQIFSVPAGLEVATFNWSDWENLVMKDGKKLTKDSFIPTVEGTSWPCNAAVNLDDKYVFVNNGVEVSFAAGVKKTDDGETPVCNQLFRSWTFGNVVELRPAEGNAKTPTFTLTAPSGSKIKEIVVVGSSATGLTPTTGTFTLLDSDTARGAWLGEESAVTFSGSKYLDQFYVFYTPGAGVADVMVDENAPVEYYNLQGVRVNAPENGIFIRRQGNKVEKIMVK